MSFYVRKYITRNGKYLFRNGKALQTYSRGKYTIEEIDALIAEGFIPVATADEFDGLRNSSLRVMGSGSPWEGVYNTGLDKKYVQVDNIDITIISSYTRMQLSGTYDGNELAVHVKSRLFASIGCTLNNIVVYGDIDQYVADEESGAFLVSISRFSNSHTYINNCHAYGHLNLLGTDGAGGLVQKAGAESYTAYISGCSFTGTIITNISIVGGIVGFAEHCMIENCVNNANIITDGNSVAGIVGNCRGGSIENCVNNGNITGDSSVGGIAGYYIDSIGEIINCENTGIIESTRNDSLSYCGGIVGNKRSGDVIYCESYGDVKYTGGVNDRQMTGGLIGFNLSGIIRDCYSSSDVTSTQHAGGLVGENRGIVERSYATGLIVGTSNIGGLIGVNTGTITNSYYDSQTSGQSDTGKGLPRTTAQLKNGTADSFINPDGTTDLTETPANAMFTGWDDLIWDFTDTTKYPELL